MKSILDKDFVYTNSASTNIRERLIANGMKTRDHHYDELARLRKLRRQLDEYARFVHDAVIFDEHLFEEMLAEADGCNV